MSLRGVPNAVREQPKQSQEQREKISRDCFVTPLLAMTRKGELAMTGRSDRAVAHVYGLGNYFSIVIIQLDWIIQSKGISIPGFLAPLNKLTGKYLAISEIAI